MNHLYPRFLALALLAVALTSPASAGRLQSRVAMLEEQGITVEAFRDEDLGLRVLVMTNPENGRQRMRGMYRDGRRFLARRLDEASEWQVRGSEEGMEVPDLSSMEPVDLPSGGDDAGRAVNASEPSAGADPGSTPEAASEGTAETFDATSEPEVELEEVTIPASG